jgi:hypothetical protein
MRILLQDGSKLLVTRDRPVRQKDPERHLRSQTQHIRTRYDWPAVLPVPPASRFAYYYRVCTPHSPGGAGVQGARNISARPIRGTLLKRSFLAWDDPSHPSTTMKSNYTSEVQIVDRTRRIPARLIMAIDTRFSSWPGSAGKLGSGGKAAPGTSGRTIWRSPSPPQARLRHREPPTRSRRSARSPSGHPPCRCLAPPPSQKARPRNARCRMRRLRRRGRGRSPRHPLIRAYGMNARKMRKGPS